jgi:hypothetical protein
MYEAPLPGWRPSGSVEYRVTRPSQEYRSAAANELETNHYPKPISASRLSWAETPSSSATAAGTATESAEVKAPPATDPPRVARSTAPGGAALVPQPGIRPEFRCCGFREH